MYDGYHGSATRTFRHKTKEMMRICRNRTPEGIDFDFEEGELPHTRKKEWRTPAGSFSPVEKFIKSKVGKNWNDAFSYLSRKYDQRSYKNDMIYRAIKHYVIKESEAIVVLAKKHFGWYKSNCFYVSEEDGNLYPIISRTTELGYSERMRLESRQRAWALALAAGRRVNRYANGGMFWAEKQVHKHTHLGRSDWRWTDDTYAMGNYYGYFEDGYRQTIPLSDEEKLWWLSLSEDVRRDFELYIK